MKLCTLDLLRKSKITLYKRSQHIAEGKGSTFRLRSRLTNQGKASKVMVSPIKNALIATAFAIPY
ncbi:MAG TPA: hypothetical protein V6D12_18675 [Candidatus Obscuribacterales bacterium]